MATAVVLVIAFMVISKVSAETALPWINSVLSFQKQADTTALPQTTGNYGNINCAMEDSLNCAVAATYGAATQNGAVRLVSSSSFLPVVTYVDNRQSFLAVPNSNTAISYFSGPAYGLNMAFNYNFASSVTKTGGTFKINRAPDGKLTDKAKRLLAADIASMSFSENGQWMVVSNPNAAMLRVNLQTFEVVPFAPGLNYTIGLDPAVKSAITNDGRYAVIASKTFNTFKIYDLSTCPAVPDTINGPVACQSRDLGSFMQQAAPGYDSIASARFLDNNALAAYVFYKVGTLNKTARFIISNTAIVSQIDYLAVGDSYISGEGAFNYIGGTDTDSNKCHLSFLAYPKLIGRDLNLNSYNSVACSGATIDDIINTKPDYKGQADNKKVSREERDRNGQTAGYLSSFMPGYINQLEFVKNYQPKVITVSMGGNDMGFSNILKICVDPRNFQTCYDAYEDRLELVRLINNQVFPNLVKTYAKLKSAGPPDMRVYAIGYPQIAKLDGNCGLNVRLNKDEILFSQLLINYLDTVIQQAAARAGVYYVDTQDALNGHRLCEAGPGSVAMNGLTAGNDRPDKLGGPIADESYHPNDFGYQLLENKILPLTNNLTNPMPAANLLAAPPAETGLAILDVPRSGRAVSATLLNPDMSADLAYRQTPLEISINGSQNGLGPNSSLQAELRSTPLPLGSYLTDANGNLVTQITIPASAPAGYHMLHFYGTDISGQKIDIYKIIYVANTANDLDGDGALDSTQRCVGSISSGQDYDQDSIDDACDGNITIPPVQPALPAPNSSAGNSQSSVSSPTLGLSGTTSESVQTGSDNSPAPAPLIAIAANPPTSDNKESVNTVSSTGNPSQTNIEPTVLGANDSSNSSKPIAMQNNDAQTSSRYPIYAMLGLLPLILLAYASKIYKSLT